MEALRLALVSCVPGELPSKSQFITLSRGATTMQVNYGEKAIGSLLLHCYIYYLSSDHSLFVFFWGDSTSQRKLTTNPFVRIPMNEPQWTLASTGRPLGRHHLQRWSGKSLKGRMAKKQLMLEAQFMPLVPRRGTYTKMILYMKTSDGLVHLYIPIVIYNVFI